MIKTSKKLLPELRFPEFSNQWVEEKTSYFLKRVSNPVNVLPDKEYQEIGVRSHGKGIFHKKIIKGKDLGDKRVFWVEVPAFLVNIVFAWEQAVAVTSIAEKGFIASHRFPMFVPNNQRSDLDFVKYFFFRPRGKFLLGIASPGGAGRNKTLGQNDFAKLKVIFPKIEEQQKIAAFLSVVDDKLSNLRRKHELLESYKRGLMQQLFSQQIRFKQDDGSDFPDWEEKKLGELVKIGSGRDYKHLDSGDIPVYGTGGLMLKVNDFLYDGESVCIGRKGTIDKPYFLSGKFWTVDTLFYTHSFKDVIPRFVFAIFQQINWKSHNEASGVPSLSKSTIQKILVSKPCLLEQQKIADFLQSVDKKIDAVAEQIIQLDTFKKGLLQKMFV